METLFNGFTLEFSAEAFPLSTDSIALAEFVKLPKNAAVLDLGSGCGTLGTLLCATDPSCSVTGIELNPQDHQMALRNRDANALSCRLESICGDIASVPSLIQPGSFHVCVSNPPYFSAGPVSKTHPHARKDDLCSPETLFRSAGWALRYGGDFFLVHRPERMAELFVQGSKFGLEPKRLRLLRHRADGPVCLILVQFRKGAKPGLLWEESALYDIGGEPTPYFRSIYHL